MDFENLWNTLLDYWLIRVPFQNQHESIQMLWSNLAVTSWKWHRAHWHEIPGPLGRPMILSGVRVVHWKHPPRPLENPKSMWEDNYSFLQLHLKWRSVGTAGVGRCILIQQWWPEMCHAVFKVTPCYVHLYVTSSSPGLRWICFQRRRWLNHHASAWQCNWLAKSSAVFQTDFQKWMASVTWACQPTWGRVAPKSGSVPKFEPLWNATK